MTSLALPPALTITVHPPEEAYDFEYHRDRLKNPYVLQHSVAIRLFRAPLLAVAAGGPRRGGYFPTPDPNVALAVRDILRGRSGFPDPRLCWPPDGVRPGVAWGEDPCCRADVRSGRFYGYKGAVLPEDDPSP
ncbi:DUF6302 family protein [Streptomyces sp. NPDC085665]|uniref:DUF6302 family protein n=1 Tax=Streptomyces sp. NPDC085665 TaxID=3365735 RepID=UPI0037D2E4E4